ncbi:MAG: prepilin-type N-terminal cleavage/methylation domain-containing protein [Thermodesulfobacteriota bacterium]|nr:prepilin-type N-terminal cleavage/methylation domain-containing protein [Thermodesulfobacteriota bacterium]
MKKGFSLIEILVALAVAGVLLALVLRVVSQVARNSEVLETRGRISSETARLRRVLHRDLQNIEGDLAISHEGFSIKTSHNFLLGRPLTVEVKWDFSEKNVRRVEEEPKLSYTKDMIFLPELKSWDAQLFHPEKKRWFGLRSWLLSKFETAPSAIKLVLNLPDREEIEMVERLPLVEYEDPSL